MEPAVTRALDSFVAAAKDAFGERLRCIALFGSAAEDRLRATSDINVALVLSAFDPPSAEQLREPLALAWTTIRLQAMFLLQAELADATAAFAVKFGDIARRRRILHGPDLFAGAAPPRAAAIAQLRQSALGLALRLREQYVDQGLHEERLVRLVAEAAGPLRACAATLLELEGARVESPRAALDTIAGDIPEVHRAREDGRLPAGVAGPVLLRLLAAAETVARRARDLR